MKLTLTDVYELRNGLIDFSNKLFSKDGQFSFKVEKDTIDKLIGCMSLPRTASLKKKEGETDKEFQKRQRNHERTLDNKKKALNKEFRDIINKGQKEVAKHMIALNVYSFLLEKQNALIENNKGRENDPIIKEFSKNVTFFKEQLAKNDIYSFEIEDKLRNNNKLPIKIKQAVSSTLNGEFESMFERLHADGVDVDKFKKEYLEAIDFDTLEKFGPTNIEEKNKPFYGLLKGSGFNFAQKFDTVFNAVPEEIAECPGGYEFNESGELVEKQSTGFFSMIANFFGRLFNNGKVNEYNTSLRQSREAAKNDQFEKEVTERTFIENEKQHIDLSIEFDSLRNYEKEASKEDIAKQRLQMKKDAEELEKFQKENPDTKIRNVGPGLDQVD